MADNHQHSTTDSIGVAFFLNLAFAFVEIVGGFAFNSMLIISDALHDLGDSLSLAVAWFFERVAQKQKDQHFTYGYGRYSLLGVVFNTIFLVSGAVLISINAVGRLVKPVKPVIPGLLLFAILGIVVNGLAVWRLRRSQSYNAKVVFWHLMEDVLGWVAALVVSILLLFTDWYFLDPLLALLITGLVIYNVIKTFRKTMAVFLQKVPENIENNTIIAHLSHLPKVQSVHHTHVWSLDGARHVLTTHIAVEENTTQPEILAIKEQVRRLAQELHCEHVTVEIERCDSECTMYPNNHSDT